MTIQLPAVTDVITSCARTFASPKRSGGAFVACNLALQSLATLPLDGLVGVTEQAVITLMTVLGRERARYYGTHAGPSLDFGANTRYARWYKANLQAAETAVSAARAARLATQLSLDLMEATRLAAIGRIVRPMGVRW